MLTNLVSYLGKQTIDLQFSNRFAASSLIAGRTPVNTAMERIQRIDIQHASSLIPAHQAKAVLAINDWRRVQRPVYIQG